jgi:hypothetical protein
LRLEDDRAGLSSSSEDDESAPGHLPLFEAHICAFMPHVLMHGTAVGPLPQALLHSS